MRLLILSFCLLFLSAAQAQNVYHPVRQGQLQLFDQGGAALDSVRWLPGTKLALIDGNACLACLAGLAGEEREQLILVTRWSEKRLANFALRRLVYDRYGVELYFTKADCQEYQEDSFCFGKDIGPRFLQVQPLAKP